MSKTMLAPEGSESSAGRRPRPATAWLILLTLLAAAAGLTAYYGYVRPRQMEDTWLQDGRAALAAGQWAEAEAALAAALAVRPGAVRAHGVAAATGRGVARYHQDKLTAALADFDAVLAVAPAQTEALAYRGLIHFRRGDDAAALADLEAVLALDPDLAEPRAYRGILVFRQGDNAAALADLEAALDQDPDLAIAYAYRALLRFRAGDAAGGEADFRQALAGPPLTGSLLARLQAGRAAAALTAGDDDTFWDSANAALQLAAHLSPGTQATLWQQQATLLAEAGRLEAAAAHLEAALALAEALPAEFQIDLYRQQADLYLAQFDWAAAADTAELALALDPDLAFPLAYRAYQQLQAGHAEAALTGAEAALALDETIALAQMARAGALLQRQDLAPALEALNDALQLDPDNLSALALRQQVLMRLGDTGAAAAHLAHALAVQPDHPETLAMQARDLNFRHEYVPARRLLDQAIGLSPRQFQYWLLRAQTYTLAGENLQRQADLLHALSVAPEHPLVKAAIHWNEFADGKYKLFQEWAETAVTEYPAWSGGYVMLAESTRLAQHDAEAALALAEAAIALNPADPAATVAHARAALAAGDFTTARADFQHALDLNPYLSPARHGLVDTAIAANESEAALAALDEWAAEMPADPGHHCAAVAYHMAQEDMAAAWASLAQLHAQDPDSVCDLTFQVRLYAAAGSDHEAAQSAAALLAAYPDSAQGHLLQAQIRVQQGELEHAADSAARAVALDPALVAAHEVLAEALLKQKDAGGLLAAAEAWLAAAPDSGPAHETRGIALAGMERNDEAAAAFETALDLDPSLEWSQFYLGLMARDQGDDATAAATFEALLATSTDIEVIDESEWALAELNGLVIDYAEPGSAPSRTWRSPSGVFAIDYPDTLVIYESDDSEVRLTTPDERPIIVWVLCEETDQPVDVQLLAAFIESSLRNDFANFRQLDEQQLEMAGLDAVQKIYSYESDVTMKSAAAYLTDDSHMAFIFLTASPPLFDTFLPVFNEIVDSFAILR